MAKNLQSKLPSSDSFLVHDVNSEILERFAGEASSTGAQVKIAEDVREAAENSVGVHLSFCLPSYAPIFILYDEFVH